MIEKTISEIEAKIGGAETVSPERRRELLQLLATLKAEIIQHERIVRKAADKFLAKLKNRVG